MGVAMRPLPLTPGGHDLGYFSGIAIRVKSRKVTVGDPALGKRPRAKPIDQAVPFVWREQDHGEVADRLRLDQRQRLEQLVERPEPPGPITNAHA